MVSIFSVLWSGHSRCVFQVCMRTSVVSMVSVVSVVSMVTLWCVPGVVEDQCCVYGQCGLCGQCGHSLVCSRCR